MANYYVINEFKNKAEIIINGYIGDWDGETNAEDFLKEFNRLAKSYKNIDIRILNSGGGLVFEGNAIISTIRQSDAIVDVYVDGLAASMAANIAISGNSLKMAKIAKILFHKATGGAVGHSDDLRSAADLLEDIEKDILGMLVEKTGKEEQYFKDEFFAGVDKFLNAEEAEELKISDGTYDKPDKENKFQDTQKELFKYSNIMNSNLNNNTMELKKVENLKMFNAFLGINENAGEVDMFKEVQKIVASNEKLTKDVADKVTEIEELTAGKDILKDELKGYKESAETSRKDKIDLLLANVPEDEREDWRNIAELDDKGFEYAKKVIEKIKPYQSVSNKIDTKKVKREDGKTWNDYHKAGELANIKENDPEFYAELYKAKFGKELK